ncbi:MAG: DUF89 family protein [Spirochaetaceae bacterium]|nr:MAG: DUF89 family protein [Spirochaetaceae bacterium]
MQTRFTPSPIRTTKDNWFAFNTMKVRLPTNIRNAAARNADLTDADRARLLALADAIAGDALVPEPALPSADYEWWMAQYERHRGTTWHDCEWFFGETYAFRLILDACRYWERGVDPFRSIKLAELDSGAAFEPVCVLPDDAVEAVRRAVHVSIWGNRSDLSFSAGGALDRSMGDESLLLVNDDRRATDILVTGSGPVHIVMDNAGAELVGDLFLADSLVRHTDAVVILHVKSHPTYVSDTTVPDFHTTVQHAQTHRSAPVRALGERIKEAFEAGRIRLAPDEFWCSTWFLTDMPGRVQRAFAGGRMVIIKGDFNYRRVMRDTIWPPDITPHDAMGDVPPTPPLLLLRTLKSDVVTGFPRAAAEELNRDDPSWRVNGRRGVIQLIERNG